MGVVKIDYFKVSPKKRIKCICDHSKCKKEFHIKYKETNLKKERTFCSKKCKAFEDFKPGGILHENLFSKENRKKARQSNLISGKETYKKVSKTIMERYGVDNISKLPEIQLKKEETNLKNFNVRYPAQDPKVLKRMYETAKKNNSKAGISMIEEKFLAVLKEIYHEDNVESQYYINGWRIDFYIKTLDIYVQFDGIYWHGLNEKLLEKTKNRNHERYKSILNHMKIDAKQNIWFKENNKKLIRITDEEFKSYHVLSIKNKDLQENVKNMIETRVKQWE